MEYNPTGADPELDAAVRQRIEDERARIQRNTERREARERLKGKLAGGGGTAASPSASAAGSPGAYSDVDAGTPAVNGGAGGGSSANGTPQKTGGRGGRNKDGTARKCANCGQVGHIKTNRKSVSPSFTCLFCGGRDAVELPGTATASRKRGAGSRTGGGGGGKRRKVAGADAAAAYGADTKSSFAGETGTALVL